MRDRAKSLCHTEIDSMLTISWDRTFGSDALQFSSLCRFWRLIRAVFIKIDDLLGTSQFSESLWESVELRVSVVNSSL